MDSSGFEAKKYRNLVTIEKFDPWKFRATIFLLRPWWVTLCSSRPWALWFSQRSPAGVLAVNLPCSFLIDYIIIASITLPVMSPYSLERNTCHFVSRGHILLKIQPSHFNPFLWFNHVMTCSCNHGNHGWTLTLICNWGYDKVLET